MNEQYYLNRGSSSCTTNRNYVLNKYNYLSEFKNEKDKEIVRDNLGISDIILNLDKKIDSKVISSGQIAWDNSPNENNNNKVLSSAALYKTLLNYITKSELDSNLQNIWIESIQKINDLQQKLECELNNSNNTSQDNISRLNTQLHYELNKLEERIRTIEVENDNIISVATGGITLSDQFGNSDNMGMTQKALTNAFNRIWDKLEQMSGNLYKGISLIVTPGYFIGNEGSEVHIIASTEDSTCTFEKLQIYINGDLVTETENVEYFEFDTTISEESIIMCKAQILGVEYTKMKTIKHYDAFWVGAGLNYSDVLNINHNVELTPDFRSNLDVTFNDNEYLFIIIGKYMENNFQRADMNGLEIQFNSETVTIDGDEYIVFKSLNTYVQGTYNIDING